LLLFSIVRRAGVSGVGRRQKKRQKTIKKNIFFILTAHDQQRAPAPPPHEHGPVLLTPALHGAERHVPIAHHPWSVA
jgi:hypothetical protein